MSRIASLALLFLLVVSWPAAGQPAPWEPERLTAGWVFTPSAVFGTLWDSNVTLQNEDTPQVRSWMATVSPRGEINFNGRRTFFNAGYAGTFQAVRELSELNRYEQYARMELRREISRRTDFRTWSGYVMSPTTDRLNIRPGVVPFVEVGSSTFDAGTGITTRLTSRTTLESTYTFSHVRFDEDESIQSEFRHLNGGYAHQPLVVVNYDLASRLSVGGSWAYTYARLQGDLKPFDVHTAMGHATYQVHQYTKVSGGAGVSVVDETSLAPSSSGLAFNAGIDQQLGSNAGITAAYSRQFVPSYSFSGVDPNHSFTAGARMNLLQGRLGLSGSLSYGRSESVVGIGDPPRAIGEPFRLASTSISATLAYAFARWIRGEVYYSGLLQSTNIQGNMDRSRIGVQFVTLKPVRIE